MDTLLPGAGMSMPLSSRMDLFLARSNTAPSGMGVNESRSWATKPNDRRISAGIVTRPLLMSLASVMLDSSTFLKCKDFQSPVKEPCVRQQQTLNRFSRLVSAFQAPGPTAEQSGRYCGGSERVPDPYAVRPNQQINGLTILV